MPLGTQADKVLRMVGAARNECAADAGFGAASIGGFLGDVTLTGIHDVLFKLLTADRLKVRLRRHLTHLPALQCVDGGLAPVRSTARCADRPPGPLAVLAGAQLDHP